MFWFIRVFRCLKNNVTPWENTEAEHSFTIACTLLMTFPKFAVAFTAVLEEESEGYESSLPS